MEAPVDELRGETMQRETATDAMSKGDKMIKVYAGRHSKSTNALNLTSATKQA